MWLPGAVSNPQHSNRKIGKAGFKRLMGWRPVVRGVAMNSVDHPHGGGRCAAALRLLPFFAEFFVVDAPAVWVVELSAASR